MQQKKTLGELKEILGSPKGVIRSLDILGRIVVPVEFREALGWNKNDLIEMQLYENSVLLIKREDQ